MKNFAFILAFLAVKITAIFVPLYLFGKDSVFLAIGFWVIFATGIAILVKIYNRKEKISE